MKIDNYYQQVLDFWFQELEPKQWWKKSTAFDALVKERFAALHERVLLGEAFSWREHAHGRLAEILVLDQFSRNMFRDQAQAFAADPMALALAQEAVHHGFDQQLTQQQRVFVYMPYMHSESLRVHEEAVKLFMDLDIGSNLDYEYRHKKIIEQFGRYPHRNAVLGRESTSQEAEFLKQPGSSF